MEPVRNAEKVKRMFAQGQSELVDTQTGYKYSMVACCPNDGNFSPVARIEKAGQALSKVTFQCNLCSAQFEASQDEIYVW